MKLATPAGDEVQPLEETLTKGTTLFRVHSERFEPTSYNPGKAPARVVSRFAFFGEPPVPVIYASDTEVGAISETILHDVPLQGGRIDRDVVESTILSAVVTHRDLKLMCLHGHGFRQIGTTPEEVTRTSPSEYAKSVSWAKAAHAAGFDGLSWMSGHHDTSKAYVFFGRPGDTSDLDEHPDPNLARPFAFPQHLDWLTSLLAPLRVNITGP